MEFNTYVYYDPVEEFSTNIEITENSIIEGCLAHKQTCEFMLWAYYNAPKWLRDLSLNGGDEDWVCICTKETWENYNEYIYWIDKLGVSDVDTFLIDKYVVFIAYHA